MFFLAAIFGAVAEDVRTSRLLDLELKFVAELRDIEFNFYWFDFLFLAHTNYLLLSPYIYIIAQIGGLDNKILQ
jgi:hypothetical protein